MQERAHLPTFTLENNESMEISADNNLVFESTKATSTNCLSRTPNSTSHSKIQMPTPPLTVCAPAPIPLDPATKTAQIIAQIKERAYAKSHSSPEVSPLEFFDDLVDSDDDFLLPDLPFVTKPARYDIISLPTYQTMSKMFFFYSSKDNTLATAALEDKSIKRTSRYSLRNRSPTWSLSNSSPPSGHSRESLSRKSPSPPKVVEDRTGKRKKTVAYNPFDTLLKEKKLGEKSGKGHDAFCRAETTTDKFAEDDLLDGMDEDDWNDQSAALAVRDRDWLINRPLTPDLNRGNGDDLSLGDVERQNFFGEDGGKAIMGILEHDKIAKREALNRQVPSLRFWSPPGAHNTSMVVDEAPSIAEISVANPLICLLKKSIQRGGMFEFLFFFPILQSLPDFCRAALILNMDFLSTAKPTEQPMIVQFLSELGMHLLPMSCSIH